MPLSSSSTIEDIKAAYDDNAPYSELGDATMARAFVTACRMLKRRLAGEHAHGAERLRLDENIRQLDNEISDANKWLNANGGGRARATYKSFRGFRS